MSTKLSNPAQVKEHVMKIKICAGFEKCLSFGGRNMPDSAHYDYKTRQQIAFEQALGAESFGQ